MNLLIIVDIKINFYLKVLLKSIYIYMYTYTYIKLQMRRDSANKNAEFSQLVLGMGCPQEQRLFINIYRCLQI